MSPRKRLDPGTEALLLAATKLGEVWAARDPHRTLDEVVMWLVEGYTNAVEMQAKNTTQLHRDAATLLFLLRSTTSPERCTITGNRTFDCNCPTHKRGSAKARRARADATAAGRPVDPCPACGAPAGVMCYIGCERTATKDVERNIEVCPGCGATGSGNHKPDCGDPF